MDYPSNQRTPTRNPLQNKREPSRPIAQVSQRTPFSSDSMNEGFKRIGNDILYQQLPNFIGKLLHSVVDALTNQRTPYVSHNYDRPNVSNIYNRYPVQSYSLPRGYAPPPIPYSEPAPPIRRSFDTFTLPDKESAQEIFQVILAEAETTGYLTVSKVYDYFRLPCSYMGVNYFWTVDDIHATELVETPSGQVRVKFPKAHVIE